jgi:nucleotide-binding universal stress UspA family protein
MTAQVPFTDGRILVPTDLTAESEGLLAHVRLLAERFDAQVTLYHAVEVPDHRHAHWAFAHEHAVFKEAERQARDALDRHAQSLGPRAHAVVERAGAPADAIVAEARRLAADLIAMSTHGRGGLSHLLLGSVTEKVIERARRPVLAFRESALGTAFPYRRILVTTDFSLVSRLVFPLAAQLAKALGAELVCVHVWPSPSVAALSGVPEKEPVVVPTESAVFRFIEADLLGQGVRVQVHRGTVWDRIVNAARTEKADLIVMSTRGHHNLADHILGSNTERVLRHAPCPVLVA